MSSEVLIYQVGRLDLQAFQDLKFSINGHRFENSLSSLAIKQYFEAQGCKASVTVLYPVSLPINKALTAGCEKGFPETFASKLSTVLHSPDTYLQEPYDLFRSHPHSLSANRFRVIHSIGKFSSETGFVSFSDCHYSDIVLEILVDLIEYFFTHKSLISKVVFDISSGHNIYISALIEAARYFGVWLDLLLLGREGSGPDLFIAFSDPIVNLDTQHAISFEKLPVKAFFSSPISSNDIASYSLSRLIYPSESKKKQKFHSMLENFLLLFSALKNNTPLWIFHTGYDDVEAARQVMLDLCSDMKKRFYRSYTSSPGLEKEAYVKVFLSLAFYIGIINLLKSCGIRPYDQVVGVESQYIASSLETVYNTLGLHLNLAILRNEVDRLRADSARDSWMPLVLFLNYGAKQERTRSSPDKRNFFAHAGFESNITEGRREGEKLFVRYNSQFNRNIRRFLLQAV